MSDVRTALLGTVRRSWHPLLYET